MMNFIGLYQETWHHLSNNTQENGQKLDILLLVSPNPKPELSSLELNQNSISAVHCNTHQNELFNITEQKKYPYQPN